MNILLLGANGQVGDALTQTLPSLGQLRAAQRNDIDLSNTDALDSALDANCPDLIVNAAAYTQVDQAEKEQDLAQRINADAPGVLARWAKKHNAGLVHFSTDYVFDGSQERPYREDDPCSPMGAYGCSKFEGEKAIRESGCRHLIFRTSWVYGARGQNFLRSILRAAGQREELSIVDDQWGSPTWCVALAECTTIAVSRMLTDHAWREHGGVYHLSARGRTTWCRFAKAFIALAVDQGLLERAPAIRPIATADWPTPASRPAFSVLDNALFEGVFEVESPDWERQLAACMAGIDTL